MDESYEAELLFRAKHGDHDSFVKLFIAQEPRLMMKCRAILGDEEMAKDAVMEGVLRAWERLLDCERSFGGWLYTITKNAALDMRREAYERRKAPLNEEISEYGGDFEDDTIWGVRVGDVLDQLSGSEREIFVLHFILEYKSRDIAIILGGISDQAARQRCSRVAKSVRKILRPSGPNRP